MIDDEAARERLRAMLLDGVAAPDPQVRETLFDATFAAEPGAGAELLPPDGLFDRDSAEDDLQLDPEPDPVEEDVPGDETAGPAEDLVAGPVEDAEQGGAGDGHDSGGVPDPGVAPGDLIW